MIVRPTIGLNRRGEVSEVIKQGMDDWKNTPADPRVFERLPRSYREQTEQYFNKIRQGR